jgi:hypothetical protein
VPVLLQVFPQVVFVAAPFLAAALPAPAWLSTASMFLKAVVAGRCDQGSSNM